jgi:hypothetical protein
MARNQDQPVSGRAHSSTAVAQQHACEGAGYNLVSDGLAGAFMVDRCGVWLAIISPANGHNDSTFAKIARQNAKFFKTGEKLKRLCC